MDLQGEDLVRWKRVETELSPWREQYRQRQVGKDSGKDRVARPLEARTFLCWHHSPLHLMFFLSAPFTAQLFQRVIYLYCLFLLSPHLLLNTLQFSRLSALLKPLLPRQPASMLANQRNILLSLLLSFSAISRRQAFLLRTISFLGFCDIPHPGFLQSSPPVFFARSPSSSTHANNT